MFRRVVGFTLLIVGMVVASNVVGGGAAAVDETTPVLTPLNPARLLDTRPNGKTSDGQAQRTGLQQARTVHELRVTGRAGVPADAAAVVLTVTAVNQSGPGFLTVYPCGIDRPTASNVNYTTSAIANAVLAKVGTNGNVCIYTENATQIIADVSAYVPQSASPIPVNPARLLDTRPGEKTVDGQAQGSGIQQAKTTVELQVTGRAGVPADATAVMLNVTAANPAGPGFITVYPCGIDRPLASNVNYTSTAVPNAVLAKIGTGGKVCLYTENTVNIIADVNGFVAAGATPIPVNPARILDSRAGEKTVDGQAQQTGFQQAKTTFELPVAGRAGVPTDAAAVVLNVTVANPAGPGFITVYPCGIERPTTSNLNYTTAAVPSAVLAKIGTGGKVCVYTESTVNIIADVNAYVPAASDTAGPTTSTTSSTTSTSMVATTMGTTTTTTDGTGTTTTTFGPTNSTTPDTVVPPQPICPANNPTISASACAALVALYNSTDGANWYNKTGWNTEADPCTWYGVTCSDDNTEVVGIDLAANRLSGAVPAEIGGLTSLSSLDLRSALYGTGYSNELTALPAEIGNLINLTELDLTGVKLAALPAEIGNLTNLVYLRLGYNRLTALPAEVGNLTRLTGLQLGYNQLTAVPTEIGNLTYLADLELQYNGLTTLPAEFGKLTGLIELTLSRNNLTALPAEFGNLVNLRDLSLYGNKLTALPAEIGNLTSLAFLYLFENELTALPAEIGNLTNLRELELSENQLVALPAEIGMLTNLTGLDVSENQLTGLPAEIGNLTSLIDLYLYKNQLASIPPEVGGLANLEALVLAENLLTALPAEIGNLTNLIWLNLGTNPLAALPPEIGTLARLQIIELSETELTTLPPEFGNLANLTDLYARNSKLSALPAEIGNLAKLDNLIASGNQLTAVPAEIGNLAKLKSLHLDGNLLTVLPPEIGNLTNLTHLYLYSNKLAALPAEIGNLSKLYWLEAFDNELTALPTELGNLTSLGFLFLADNQLVGDVTAPLNPLRLANNLGSLTLYGNGCLTTTDPALAAWLTTKDSAWNAAC